MPGKKNETDEAVNELPINAVLRKNGALTDEEIEEKLHALREIGRTPAELAQKEQFEKIIREAKKSNEQIQKQKKSMHEKAGRYSDPYAHLDKTKLKEMERNLLDNKAAIVNAEHIIRDISNNKILNQEAYDRYMGEYVECFNRIQELKKERAHAEENGDYEEFTRLNETFFAEKKRLIDIKNNKPVPLDEGATIDREQIKLQKEIRKSLSVKLQYYMKEIDQAIVFAKEEELASEEILDELSWKSYGEKFPRQFERTLIASYYCGLLTDLDPFRVRQNTLLK